MKILVLGCGSIGQRHIMNLLTLQMSGVFAYDLSSTQRHQTHAKFGIEVVPSLQAAWKLKPEVVLITVPTQHHLSLAMQAVSEGCHVFVEKPLFYTLEGIDKLLSQAVDRNAITMVGCNMRFHSGPSQLKRLLEERAIGDPIAARIHTGSFLPRWRSSYDYHQSYSASSTWGGATLDCIHEIDIAWWFFGKAKVIAAEQIPAHSIGLKTDGLIEILLKHDSGTLSSIHLNFIQRDYKRAYQIIGSEGSLYWEFNDKKVRIFDSNGELSETINEPDGWQPNQMFLEEMKYFLSCVGARKNSFNDFKLAADVLGCALKARNMSLMDG